MALSPLVLLYALFEEVRMTGITVICDQPHTREKGWPPALDVSPRNAMLNARSFSVTPFLHYRHPSSIVSEVPMDRRIFLKKAAAVTIATSLNRKSSHAADAAVPHRTLGRSGEKVSIIGLGGHHIGRPGVSEQEGIRIIRTALDNGVNFLDNCWDYNDGLSEERMGRALRDGYRQRAFLMTKIDGQTRKAATDQ